MKVLVLEDRKMDFDTLQSALRQYIVQHPNNQIILDRRENPQTFTQALEENDYDGFVCDIKMRAESPKDGNKMMDELLEKLNNNLHLMPLAILTNVPAEAEDNPWVPVFAKERSSYPKLFDHLWNSYQTGISKISGKDGIFLKKLKEIFSFSIEKHFDTWKEKIQKGKSHTSVQKSLQRYILAHLLYELSEDKEPFQPEEFFLYTQEQKLTTGRIFKKDDKYFLLITPPCNLEQGEDIWHFLPITSFSHLKAKKQRSIRENKTLSKHYVPALSKVFSEMCLDFMDVIVCKNRQEYEATSYQVSPEFIKNIQNRFASYYARQGQPDMDLE